MNFNSKEELLLDSLKAFYREHVKHFIIITKVLKENQFISLRLLDWLVTNYSKKNNIIYTNNNNTFNIFLEYKNQLKSFSKRYFDPFCRRHRIFYSNTHDITSLYDKEKCDLYKKRNDGFVTTLAQLNFFKWIIQYQVIEYALIHLHAIEKDMILSLSKHYKRQKLEPEKETRKELSTNVLKSYTCFQLNVTITFK